MNLLRTLKAIFAKALDGLVPDAVAAAELVKPVQDAKFGDYQANCAMPLGKQLKKNPRDVAKEIVARLDLAGVAAPPEIAGPGFINLRLSNDWLATQLGQLARDERLGVEPVARPKTFVVDFSSPNVAKPMHVGHIRSTIIGDSITRVLQCLGHRVITDNHIGDWGTQFGMLIFGHKHLLDEAAFATAPLLELARLYRLVNWLSENASSDELATRAAADPKLVALATKFPDAATLGKFVSDESRQETAKLHAGDPTNRALWQSFMPHCLADLDRVYDRLGIRFDHHFGESFYDPMLPGVVDSLIAKGIAEESDGAICVFLDPAREKPPCLIRKSDGAFLYATSDLACVKHRMESFHPDAILYVVGQPQALHFQQFFEVARRWGYDQVELTHVAFGTILGGDGKPFRTRAGGTVGLEPLLDEAVERARKIVDENSPELSEAARREVAEAVGIGAIKYADLSVNRTSDYTFDWDRMMAMQGNTATYLQYAYARIQSIFRKGGVAPAALRADPPAISLAEPAERALAVAILRFPETLEDAAADYKPNVIAGYLYNLAESFSSFYNTCDVLKAATPDLRASRLALADLTGRTLKQGLELLGIRTIEQM